MPFLRKSTILVTGGAGFIGANFIKYVNSTYPQAKIVNLDSLTYCGNLENLEGIENNYYFVKGDICDPIIVNKVFAKYDPNIVVNFAAESHVDRSIVDPKKFLETNILGTQVLLDAARNHWKNYDNKLFLQISTDEVYGSLENNERFTEETPLDPRSPYSASKAAADLIVKAYRNTYGLPFNITRCSNNYGPYQFPEKLIPLTINNILQLKKIPVYGDGTNIRDWLYVEDHCKALCKVIEKGRQGETYNIGGNNETKNVDLVKLIIDHTKKSIGNDDKYRNLINFDVNKINHGLIKFVKDRPGHDKHYAINPTKIETEIGWKAETSFKEGITKTIKWYLDNIQWSKNIVNGEYQKYYKKMYEEQVI